MSKTRDIKKISEIIIHCAATPNGDERFTAEDIDAWHKERGFKRSKSISTGFNPKMKYIGYHNVITIDGTLQPGRAIDETGAHARGHNTSGIGVCMIGTDRFTIEQWIALRMYVNIIQSILGKDLMIYGHRELPNVHKTCPGFSVSEWLSQNMTPDEEWVL